MKSLQIAAIHHIPWLEDRHTLSDGRICIRLTTAAKYGADAGLEIHAGHGLTYANVAPIAAIPQIRELNIGHFLIGEAIFVGLDESIRQMRRRMELARV